MSEIEPAKGRIVLRPAEHPAAAYTDLDYSITEETARNLIAATPENTRLAYARAWGQFEKWCGGEGRIALPATPQTLADYVSVLAGSGLAPATIGQAIGVIRATHRKQGFKGQPDTAQPLKLLRGYRKQWADAGHRVRKKTPVLLASLREMVATCDPATPIGVRDRALLLLGFNMMARRSELAGLDLADLREVDGEGLGVYLKHSKTDQDAEGIRVPVPYGQHQETCAVRAVQAWTALLAERGVTSGALFRPVDRHGRIGTDPGAAGISRPRLTGKGVGLIVRHRAGLAGLPDPETYGGHSLRSGAATTAYAAGVPVSVIAQHGRWLPTSPVVLGYIRAVDDWKNNPMKGIGL